MKRVCNKKKTRMIKERKVEEKSCKIKKGNDVGKKGELKKKRKQRAKRTAR